MALERSELSRFVFRWSSLMLPLNRTWNVTKDRKQKEIEVQRCIARAWIPFRKKWKWRERNEALAGYDHKAEADHCAVASLEARVKDTLYLDRRQMIFCRASSADAPPPVDVTLTRQLFLLLDIPATDLRRVPIRRLYITLSHHVGCS